VSIFRLTKQKADQLLLKGAGFGNEAELRDFFALNLDKILGVRFLEKEYQTTDGRIDTLGIDENNSPVIVEYKWKENEEIFSQGLFYFNWLVKNKKHFELLVQKHLGTKVKVNWDQPRVILIARGFSRYIKAAVQTVGNVELKSYNLYEGDILQIENEYSPLPEKSQTTKKLDQKAAIYDLAHHLNSTSPEMQKLVSKLRDEILQLPSVEEKLGQKSGITYRTTKSFTRLEFRKTWIQVLLRDPKYAEDTKGLVRDISSNEWGYAGTVKFTPESDLEYLFTLIMASYNSTL
jgi:predicted transport protein